METTNVCGTCKYRGKTIQKDDPATDFGRLDTSYFLCDLIKHDQEYDYLKGQGALTIDGSGYRAALCVEDDFGCNKWEVK